MSLTDIRLRLHGTWSTVKLTGTETGGRLAVLEEELPEGPGPPLHSHPEDETYILLDGEATFWVDADPATEKGLRRGPGAVVFVPGGAPHTYRVESTLLRLLVLSTPAASRSTSSPSARPTPARPSPRVSGCGRSPGSSAWSSTARPRRRRPTTRRRCRAPEACRGSARTTRPPRRARA